MASLFHPYTWGLSDAPKHKRYDFIVVGGGSAGCAVASRLSEDRNFSVLLLEAGGHGLVLDARIPAACGKLQHSDLDYADFAEPQPDRACMKLFDGKSFWPRGKCLGGSSVLNYMAYVRGAPEDYDSWARVTNDDRWSWKNILPVMKRMERRQFYQPGQVETKLHGELGPLTVSIRQPVHPSAKDFVNAAAKTGATIGDYNGAVQNNKVGYFQQTVKDGARCSSADAYIWENLHRPNLEVVCHATGHRVLFKQVNGRPRAYGVEFSLADGVTRVVECQREIIVSCSAVGSPALLMRSGVGAKEDLKKHGIECVVDNENVGKHLEDHVFAAVLVLCKKGMENVMKSVNKATAENMPGAISALVDWASKGEGLLASSAYDASYFFKTGLNDHLSFPDGQIGLFVSPANKDLFQKNLRFDDIRHLPEKALADDGEGIIIVNTLLHPRSKGRIELKSKDPKVQPRIFANYFVDDVDLDALAKVCVRSMEIVKNMDLAGEVTVPEDLKHLPLDSMELWREVCKRYGTTLYHPGCTLKMGAVVNSDLSVKGVSALRVADASVFPHLTSGNTNVPSILIGEVCADILAQDHGMTLGGIQPEAPNRTGRLMMAAGIAALAILQVRSKL